MTVVAWLAILGPIAAAAGGIGIGYFMGKASNAEDVGQLRERIRDLEADCHAAAQRLRALAASPPSRRESGRVLDILTGANGAA